MLKIATIGLGNAGNQIADLAMSTYGIPGIAINSSQKDLVNVSQKIMKVVLGDSKGAGKSRDEAKNFVQKFIGELMTKPEVIEFINEYDVIFIASSIGGGTGSGMSPIISDILSRKFPDKKFVLVQVYPTIGESVAAQQNAIDYLKEVHQFIPNAVYLSYDNNRRTNMSSPEMMKSVNREIVDMMNVISGAYMYDTPFNSIDEKDMARFINTPGRMAVYILDNIKEKDFDNKSIEDALIDVIKNTSASVELDRDKIVKRLGIITNLNENLNKMLDTNLPKVKALIGEPVESYEHTYICKSNDEPNRVIIIAAGLSVPDDRLTKITQRIEEGIDELNRVKERTILDDYATDVIRDLRGSNSDNSSADCNLDDIFGKFIR